MVTITSPSSCSKVDSERRIVMLAEGAPGRLKPFPRWLLFTEMFTSGTGTLVGLWTWIGPGVVRRPSAVSNAGSEGIAPHRSITVHVATAVAACTFSLHAIRQAIYLSPGHGRLVPTPPDRQTEGATLAVRQCPSNESSEPVSRTTVILPADGLARRRLRGVRPRPGGSPG